MTEPIVEQIDRDVFKALGRRGTSNVQRIAMNSMVPGDTLALTHEGLPPCDGTTEKCAINQRLNYIKRRRPDVFFMTKHMPDGRLAVACFAKESTP